MGVNMFKFLTISLLLTILFLSPAVYSQAQFYTLPGNFVYALNAERQVIDSNSNGTIAVGLTNSPVQVHMGLVSSFNPVTGIQLDSEIAGFGPHHIQTASTSLGTRVAALTGQDISIYSLNSAGDLTQLGKSSLTDSNTDYRSTLALSGSARVGFVLMPRLQDQSGSDLVVFSLDTSAVVTRLPVGQCAETIALKEYAGRRTLLLLRKFPNRLVKIDITNPSQPVETASLLLPNNLDPSSLSTSGLNFSADGHWAFIANTANGFTVVDLPAMTVSHFMEGYFLDRVEIYETATSRLLLLALPGNSFAINLLLVDASDPSHPSIVNQKELPNGKTGFTFSRFGSRAIVATEAGFKVLEIPSMNLISESAISNPAEGLFHSIQLAGHSGRVLSAWGVFTALIGSLDVAEVTPFDLCIQEDGGGRLLQINTLTGDYLFTECSGASFNGRGTLNKKGCTITLQNVAGDHRITAKIDTCGNKATASLSLNGSAGMLNINDRNLANNTCNCN
jgi:hypothetical protein